MVQIILYPILTIIILLFLGYGLTDLLMPLKLKSYNFWFSPWFAIIFIIVSYVIFGFLGFTVKTFSIIAILFLTLLNLYAFIKKGKFQFTLPIRDLIIFFFVIINIIFNLSPLIRRDKFMTSISLGNNDISAYVLTADYLVNHSLLESFSTPRSIPSAQHVGSVDLIQNLYRWGEGIISGFLLNIFHLQGYQYIYILQVVLFALAIPLLYFIFELIYKPSLFGMILTLIITGFNANLLYILYHDFFGQVLYWGLQLFIIFLVFSYFSSEKNMTSKYNIYDFVIGTSLAALCFSYHEAMIFVIAPLVIFIIFRLIIWKNIFDYWTTIVKIFTTTFLISSYSIFMALIYDYFQTFGANHNNPIGWQLFRQKVPYANPFEMMGFYSIHSFAPLPTIIALLLSAMIIIFIIKGIAKSKTKILIISFLIVYLMFYIYTGILMHNFFSYNRAVTFSLFLFLILFIIGLLEFVNNRKYLKLFIIFLLVSLEMFSAVKLNKRFITERLSVDKSLISIKEISSIKVKEPIYMESYLDNGFPLWKQLWEFYFLYFDNPNSLIFPVSVIPSKIYIPDNSLVLISKPTPWFIPPKLILKNIIWENQYYRLGRLCNNTECLMNRTEDLSDIKMGKTNFEDSLLISGWAIKESDNRWASDKKSTLRLVTKNNYPKNLFIEASSLNKPQEITAYLDDKLLGKISIDAEWRNFDMPINYQLSFGIHIIKFIYSYGYRPMDVIPGNIDNRTLYVNFKEIKLE